MTFFGSAIAVVVVHAVEGRTTMCYAAHRWFCAWDFVCFATIQTIIDEQVVFFFFFLDA
jgi:hypothetical protein